MNRRKYLLLSVPLFAGAAVYPFMNQLTKYTIQDPKNKGAEAPASRFKRTKIKNNCIGENPIGNILKPGFYINKSNVLHYIDQRGICLSLKNVHKEEKERFIKNLKPVTMLSRQANLQQIQVPFALSVFCKEVNRLEHLGQLGSAALVAEAALRIYHIRRYDTMYFFAKFASDWIKKHQDKILPNRAAAIQALINNVNKSR